MQSNNSYEWVVSTLDIDVKDATLEKVIKNVHWRCIGRSEDGYVVDTFNVLELDPPDQEAFIPYNEVRKDQVIQWLEQKLNFTEIKESLDIKIEQLRTPVMISIRPEFS